MSVMSSFGHINFFFYFSIYSTSSVILVEQSSWGPLQYDHSWKWRLTGNFDATPRWLLFLQYRRLVLKHSNPKIVLRNISCLLIFQCKQTSYALENISYRVLNLSLRAFSIVSICQSPYDVCCVNINIVFLAAVQCAHWQKYFIQVNKTFSDPIYFSIW